MAEQVPAWWRKPRNVSVVVDNDSWVLPLAEDLVRQIEESGDRAVLSRAYEEVLEGGIAFFLGCTGIAHADILARNERNLIVHESALPEGRGFSPLTWQVLEGRDRIPVCLLEAAAGADEGAVIYRDELAFVGHELCPELRAAQGSKTVELCLRYLSESQPPSGQPQEGEASYFRRRRPEDSELDPEKTIAEQFDLLRVCDNERYPAFFRFQGRTYVLKIAKVQE